MSRAEGAAGASEPIEADELPEEVTGIAPRPSRAATVAAWAWGVVLTLLYAFMVVNAVGNLLGMQQIGGSLGDGLSIAGWFWLLLGVCMPIAAYAVALLVGRKHRAGIRLLALLAGIAVVSAFQLEIMHLVPQLSYFAV